MVPTFFRRPQQPEAPHLPPPPLSPTPLFPPPVPRQRHRRSPPPRRPERRRRGATAPGPGATGPAACRPRTGDSDQTRRTAPPEIILEGREGGGTGGGASPIVLRRGRVLVWAGLRPNESVGWEAPKRWPGRLPKN